MSRRAEPAARGLRPGPAAATKSPPQEDSHKHTRPRFGHRHRHTPCETSPSAFHPGVSDPPRASPVGQNPPLPCTRGSLGPRRLSRGRAPQTERPPVRRERPPRHPEPAPSLKRRARPACWDLPPAVPNSILPHQRCPLRLSLPPNPSPIVCRQLPPGRQPSQGQKHHKSTNAHGGPL